MSRSMAVAVLLILPVAVVFADFGQTISEADALHDQGQYLQARTLLLDAVDSASASEKAELYWRAARENIELGDIAEKEKQPKDSILKVFDEGEGFANKAIDADQRSYQAYYWKSANIGRWGQVKGILDSLGRAGPMKELLLKDISINPEHSDAYFVLGQLYRELPGWPLSFGNIDYAVSLGRMAVDLRTEQVRKGTEKDPAYNFSVELAKTLYKRNWSAATRVNNQKNSNNRFNAAKNDLERGSAYEGTVTLEKVSDREEAKALVTWAIQQMESLQSRTAGQEKDLADARLVLKGW
jgi:tetratricopeptide (TPR) repeat protein